MSLYKRIELVFTLVQSYTTRELKMLAEELGVPVDLELAVIRREVAVIRREVAERLFNPTSMGYDIADLMIRENFDDE